MTKFYNCEDVAKRYGVLAFTIREWVKQKKIPAIKVGKTYLFKEEDLEQFENERRTIKEE